MSKSGSELVTWFVHFFTMFIITVSSIQVGLKKVYSLPSCGCDVPNTRRCIRRSIAQPCLLIHNLSEMVKPLPHERFMRHIALWRSVCVTGVHLKPKVPSLIRRVSKISISQPTPVGYKIVFLLYYLVDWIVWLDACASLLKSIHLFG